MHTQTLTLVGSRTSLALRVIAASMLALVGAGATAATLDRIKETGRIKLGYLADARPFTHTTPAGNVQGYSVELCDQIVERVRGRLTLPQLAVEWVPVTLASHLSDVQQGKVDLLCTPTAETAAKRQEVAYSKPVFPAGVRAVVRRDTHAALRKALGDKPAPQPVWRGSPASRVLDKANFAVAAGTSTERWLAERMKTLQVTGKAVPVESYRAGIQALLDRKADVFFGDRGVVLGVMDSDEASANLMIIERWFTHEPLGLALARNDDDFRLLVDRTLSDLYAQPTFGNTYSKWLGTFDENTSKFFDWVQFAP